MAGLFLASPNFQPLPSGDENWTPLAHSWQAWDGTLWDLSSGRSGVYLRPGLRGLGMPPIIRYSQKSPAVAGSFYRGSTVDERDVFWNVKVFRNTGSQDWIEHNRRWWRSLNPTKTGKWVVTQPSGDYRNLEIRLVDDSGFTWASDTELDPEIAGFANYGLNLVAEQPYWQGAPISISWRPEGSPQPFFSPPGSASVFSIGSSNAVFGARIANPGDVDAWPVWKVNGPYTVASVGVGSRLISLPARTNGQSITVDTNPAAQTATDQTGADITAQLGSVDFAPVPPGDPTQLNVTMTGTGSVDVTVVPNYLMGV
jgi:hypothetical protein